MTSISESTLSLSIQVFDQTASMTNLFVLPLFLVRVVIANVTGSGTQDYTGAFKGVVIYVISVYGFEPILRILLELPEAFLPQASALAIGSDQANASASPMIPSVLRWTLEATLSTLYYLAVFLNYAFSVVMSAIAPVILLLGSILGIGLGLRTFFGLLIVVSSWPIVWAACNELQKIIGQGVMSSLGQLVFEIAITLIKIAGPLAIALFGTSSAPGRAVIASVSYGLIAGKAVGGGAMNFSAGVAGKSQRYQSRPLRESLSRVTTTAAYGLGKGVRQVGANGARWMGRGFKSEPPTKPIKPINQGTERK